MPIRRSVLAGIVLSLCAFPLGAAEPEPAKIPPDAPDEPLPDGAVARFGKPRLYQYALRRLAFSPDGKAVATSGRGNPHVWDLATGRSLPYPHLEDSGEGINHLGFTPDGAHLLVDDKGVRIVDPRTGKVGFSFQHEGRGARDAVLSADGRMLAAHWGTSVTVHDLTDGPNREPRILEGGWHPNWDDKLCFSADGAFLARARDADSVAIWDARSGKRLQEYGKAELAKAKILAVALSPDGKKLAAALAGGVRVWDTDTNAAPKGFTPPNEECSLLRFSTDGKELVGVVSGREVVRWSAEKGRELRRLGNKDGPSYFAGDLAPDGKTLASCDGRGDGVRVVDLAANKILPGSERFSALIGLRWLGPDRLGVIDQDDGRVLLWAAGDGRLIREYRVPGARILSPDGKRVVAKVEKSFALVDFAAGKELGRIAEFEDSDDSSSDKVSFSADGKLLVALDEQSGSALWDAATGKFLRKLPGEGSDRAIFGPDLRTVIFAGATSLTFVESASGRVRSEVTLPTDSAPDWSVETFRTSRDGRTLAMFRRHSVDAETSWTDVCVYWPERRRFLRMSTSKTGEESVVGDLSSNGRWLAQGFSKSGRHGVRIYDLDAPLPEENPLVLAGHALRVANAAFSPDGKYLATTGEEGVALVWDLRRLAGAPKPAKGHAAGLELQWKLLAADDAEEACRAMTALERFPEIAVPWLKAHLPAEAPAGDRVRKLLADLGSTDFETRDRAARALEELAELAEAELRAALARKPNLDLATRLQRLLDRLDEPLAGDRLRCVRAVELLERIGTPEAVELLKALAGGAPAARLTREATAAVERLSAAGDR